MERLKGVASWVVFAFLIGAAMAVGSKAVDYFWPDIPRGELIIKHEGGACE